MHSSIRITFVQSFVISFIVLGSCLNGKTNFTNGRLPEPPTNIKITSITATSVSLTWSYPEDNLYYFVIRFRRRNINEAFREISGIISPHYTIQYLSPYTEYEIYVITAIGKGWGPPSPPAYVATAKGGL